MTKEWYVLQGKANSINSNDDLVTGFLSSSRESEKEREIKRENEIDCEWKREKLKEIAREIEREVEGEGDWGRERKKVSSWTEAKWEGNSEFLFVCWKACLCTNGWLLPSLECLKRVIIL